MNAYLVTGSLLTTFLGLMSFFWPEKTATMLGIKAIGVIGRVELRATYGGFFIVLGLGCLFIQEAASVVGAAWVMAATIRLISLLLIRKNARLFIYGVCIEGSIGTLLLVSRL